MQLYYNVNHDHSLKFLQNLKLQISAGWRYQFGSILLHEYEWIKALIKCSLIDAHEMTFNIFCCDVISNLRKLSSDLPQVKFVFLLIRVLFNVIRAR